MLPVLIPSLTAIAALGIGAAEYFRFRRSLPDAYYRNIGIQYAPGAQNPWERLHPVIDAIIDTTRANFPAECDRICQFWIRIVPPDGVVSGFTVPTGVLPNGHQLNGTIDSFSAFLGAYHRRILVVRQLRDESGRIQPATISALAHEYAEHLLPFELNHDWNWYHDPKWRELTQEIEVKSSNVSFGSALANGTIPTV